MYGSIPQYRGGDGHYKCCRWTLWGVVDLLDPGHCTRGNHGGLTQCQGSEILAADPGSDLAYVVEDDLTWPNAAPHTGLKLTPSESSYVTIFVVHQCDCSTRYKRWQQRLQPSRRILSSTSVQTYGQTDNMTFVGQDDQPPAWTYYTGQPPVVSL